MCHWFCFFILSESNIDFLIPFGWVYLILFRYLSYNPPITNLFEIADAVCACTIQTTRKKAIWISWIAARCSFFFMNVHRHGAHFIKGWKKSKKYKFFSISQHLYSDGALTLTTDILWPISTVVPPWCHRTARHWCGLLWHSVATVLGDITSSPVATVTIR
jgi:hypothetical protein